MMQVRKTRKAGGKMKKKATKKKARKKRSSPRVVDAAVAEMADVIRHLKEELSEVRKQVRKEKGKADKFSTEAYDARLWAGRALEGQTAIRMRFWHLWSHNGREFAKAKCTEAEFDKRVIEVMAEWRRRSNMYQNLLDQVRMLRIG